jgi:bifunctional DNA-binding transcriptional regulator/antitoxin component of YhaV-PrlF toxin-antitoxin module
MSSKAKIAYGRIDSRGYALIPKAIREAVGLKPNALYDLSIDDQNRLVVAAVSDRTEAKA